MYKFGMPIMLAGFITTCIGVLVNTTRGDSWSMPVAITGLVIYITGRVLHTIGKNKQ